MPTYEYGCSSCGKEWEEMQRITAPPTEVCPKCGKPTAHRLISAGTNFILKGGGWYSDLYSSSNGKAKKEESKGETSTDSTSSGKAEGGKSEAKSETKSDSTAPAAASPTPSSTPSSGS
jgi:putative FmdB family regulatory protein